jgi:molybdate-binding protein/DNA-binding transcriptional regulator YhcF (GntR family)
MAKTALYKRIAESIRQRILSGDLRPGDSLLAVREMAAQWNCTPGTVQRAYRELADQGILECRPGQGSRVISPVAIGVHAPLRQLGLVNQAEAFLLEVLPQGYSPSEVERALRIALDRWRAAQVQEAGRPSVALCFVGSHDPAVSLLAAHLADRFPELEMQITYRGSLGGLIALARGEADLAGCHLWDQETDSYNEPFIRRLLPGQRMALLTLAHRRLGLVVPPGNPRGIRGLEDLTRPELRFINRQEGAGTRVWLDAQLRRMDLSTKQIAGYEIEVQTHSEVARAVAEGDVDVGLGVEAAALAYHLDFVLLAVERYDLVISETIWDRPVLKATVGWLDSDEGRAAIEGLGGYDIRETGQMRWVNP